MRTLLFPKQVKFQQINIDEVKKSSANPSQLQVTIQQAPQIKNKKLILKAELKNEGDQFVLIVSPCGGGFPYGGTNPFYVRFSQSNGEVIKYIGPAFPPQPPLPMKIIIPAKSTILFTAAIDLELYQWEGTPEVLLDWAFYSYTDPYPQGTIKVKLPLKKNKSFLNFFDKKNPDENIKTDKIGADKIEALIREQLHLPEADKIEMSEITDIAPCKIPGLKLFQSSHRLEKDPMPVDIWVVVNSSGIYKGDKILDALKEINYVPQTGQEALNAGKLIIFSRKEKDSVFLEVNEKLINDFSAKPFVLKENNYYEITLYAAMRLTYYPPSPHVMKYIVRLGKNVYQCRMAEGYHKGKQRIHWEQIDSIQ